jgi:hypothetical protein
VRYVNVAVDMASAVKRAALTLATVIYVFVASGLLWRLTEKLPGWPPALSLLSGLLSLCFYAVVLSPLCVLAAFTNPRILALVLYYLGLLYVGIWGGAIIGGQQLAFDAPPGLRVSWQEQVMNSFVLLPLLGILQLAPTGAIWLLAKAIVGKGAVRWTL